MAPSLRNLTAKITRRAVAETTGQATAGQAREFHRTAAEAARQPAASQGAQAPADDAASTSSRRLSQRHASSAASFQGSQHAGSQRALSTLSRGVTGLGRTSAGITSALAHRSNPFAAMPDGFRIEVRGYATKADPKGETTAEIIVHDPHEETRLVVMVDSGLGGALTTAQLKNDITQFGHYLCLPIGDKTRNENINFTASMIAFPFLWALKNGSGRSNERVADGIIIACNSASVNAKAAIEVVRTFVGRVRENPDAFDLPGRMKSNAIALAGQLDKEPDHLAKAVSGVIDATTDRIAQDAVDALVSRNGPGQRDAWFVRVDSTNATAASRLYPSLVGTKTIEALQGHGYRLVEEKSLGRGEPQVRPVEVDGQSYNVTHTMLVFEPESGKGPRKTLFLEGRGNPPWVPIIEDLKTDLKGEEAVQNSLAASRKAAEGLPDTAKAVFGGAPNYTANCCTHYDAMSKALREVYAGVAHAPDVEGPGEMVILSQSDVVRTLHERMGGRVLDSGEARLAITRGVPGPLADRKDKARFVGDIAGSVRKEAGINSPFSVTMHNLHPRAQDAFVTMTKHIAMAGPSIGADHGYEFSGRVTPQGDLVISDVVATELGRSLQVQSRRSPLAADIDPRLAARITALEQLGAKGEARGIDFLKTRTDGSALLRITEHLVGVVARNRTAQPANREPVGIVTGFTVVDKDGHALGGENDGPPGAVVMARQLAQKGTPVVLVTDEGALPSLLSAMRAAGLAKVGKDSTNRPVRDLDVGNHQFAPGVEVVVHRRSDSDADFLAEVKEQNLGTLISIERPGPNAAGRMSNMLGMDISRHNANFGALGREVGPKVYRIAIGDGGNELGTDPVGGAVSSMRKPNNTEVVAGGAGIAVDSSFDPDALLLASVSNNGGVEVALALQVGLKAQPETIRKVVTDYMNIVRGMAADGLSVDGVVKDPAGRSDSVDGRALGSLAEAQRSPKDLGSREATHSDMFVQMLRTLEVPVPQAR